MGIVDLIIIAKLVMAPTQIGEHLREAGFKESVIPTMICIAKYESAYDAHAVGINKNGSKDLGLFQINERVWKDHCPVDKLLLVRDNIACAKIVYDKQGLEAWVAYKKHRKECDEVAKG